MRNYVTPEELLAILNDAMAENDACVDCTFRGPILRLKEPLSGGLNWSKEVIFACPGRPAELCGPAAHRIVEAASLKYALANDVV